MKDNLKKKWKTTSIFFWKTKNGRQPQKKWNTEYDLKQMEDDQKKCKTTKKKCKTTSKKMEDDLQQNKMEYNLKHN
jgi:hypothetical protein